MGKMEEEEKEDENYGKKERKRSISLSQDGWLHKQLLSLNTATIPNVVFFFFFGTNCHLLICEKKEEEEEEEEGSIAFAAQRKFAVEECFLLVVADVYVLIFFNVSLGETKFLVLARFFLPTFFLSKLVSTGGDEKAICCFFLLLLLLLRWCKELSRFKWPLLLPPPLPPRHTAKKKCRCFPRFFFPENLVFLFLPAEEKKPSRIRNCKEFFERKKTPRENLTFSPTKK